MRIAPQRGVRRDAGSVVLMVPTAILILVILSAIAVDLSTMSMAQRSLQDTVEASADDAAAMVDEARIRSTGQVAIDVADAERVAIAAVAAANLPGSLAEPVRFEALGGGTRVRVSATVAVKPIFGSPLDSSAHLITATAYADVEPAP